MPERLRRSDAEAGLASLLVVPGGALGRDVGGGQRTALFERALAELGEVDALILNLEDKPWRKDSRLPFSRRVISVRNRVLVPRRSSRLGRLMVAATKIASPKTIFRTDPWAAERFREIVSDSRYDLILFRFFQTMTVVRPPRAPRLAARVVLDIDDRDDQKYAVALESEIGSGLISHSLAQRMSRKIRDLQELHLRDTDLLWTTTAEDALGLEGPRESVVPNTSYNLPKGTPSLPSQGKSILFVGGAGHRPNVDGMKWFLGACWPLIVAKAPGARLVVVGDGPWESALGAAAKQDGIFFRGRVDNLDEAYSDARLVIVPTFSGGGSKVKLVEACGYARPVVCLPHAVRGFSEGLGPGLALADTPKEFVSKCLAYIEDPAAADHDGAVLAAAHAEFYDPAKLCERIIEDVTALFESNTASSRVPS